MRISALLKLADDFKTKVENLQKTPQKLDNQEFPTIKKDIVDHEQEMRQKLRDAGVKELTTSAKEAEKILEKNNIEVIRYLSEGSYSRVFEVKYDGHIAIAKVTNSPRDAQVIKELYNLKSSMGSLGKHILNVYNIIEDKDSSNTPVYIILVEELKKLNSHISHILTNAPTYQKPEKDKYFDKVYLQEPNIIKPIIKERLKDVKSNNFTKIINACYEAWLNILKNNMSPLQISNELRDKLKNVVEKEETMHDITAYLLGTFNGLLNRAYFPSAADEKSSLTKVYEHAPETSSLMKALTYLHDKGYSWADVRKPNLMERPRTGDIVISDPGWFGIF